MAATSFRIINLQHQVLPAPSDPSGGWCDPRTVHTAAPVPIHWQEQVLSDLKRDEALGVIEMIPYGEPVSWCHRMVVTRKHNETPRRSMDLSPLNKHCKRETFPTESPFHLAGRMPKGTWKTVSDAWKDGPAIIASPSVYLTVNSQPSSLRSDDWDTRGHLKASFPRVTLQPPLRCGTIWLWAKGTLCWWDHPLYDTDL